MRSKELPDENLMYKGSCGRVSIEALATMFLLLLLGVCIFSLAITSTSAYERIYAGTSVSSGVRTALSFVEMKIRQNDTKGAVRIENNPVNNDPSLVITEEYDNGIYETWIYLSNGKLREAFMPEGEPPSDDLSFEIAALDSFTVNSEGKLIHISIAGDQQGKEITLESSIMLRSGS